MYSQLIFSDLFKHFEKVNTYKVFIQFKVPSDM